MKVPPRAARRPRLLVGADRWRFCVSRCLPRNHQIRRRHFIRATKERLRKRDRPLVPRSRNPLCVCPWGNPKGGTPFGAPSAMCQIDCSKGRTRGTPKEWVPFLCLCASRFFYYPTTWGSTYKSAGGTLSGTTKERLRKRDRPLVPRRRNPLCVCPWGNPKGGTPLWGAFCHVLNRFL